MLINFNHLLSQLLDQFNKSDTNGTIGPLTVKKSLSSVNTTQKLIHCVGIIRPIGQCQSDILFGQASQKSLNPFCLLFGSFGAFLKLHFIVRMHSRM